MADRVRILPLRCSIQELSVHKVEFAKWESGQSENCIFVICFAGKIVSKLLTK